MKANKRITLKVQDLYLNSHHIPGDTCWHWTGAIGKDKCPRIYTFDHAKGEKRCMSVGTAVWNISRKESPGTRLPYRKCWCSDCVNPDHLLSVASRGDLMKVLGAAGKLAGVKHHDPATRSRLAAQIGKTVTPEIIVKEILASPEKGSEIAARLGVSQQCVSKIRTGKSHRYLSEVA